VKAANVIAQSLVSIIPPGLSSFFAAYFQPPFIEFLLTKTMLHGILVRIPSFSP
jgi:hypothetical protein